MNKLVEAYIEYILTMDIAKIPVMPTYDICAYTESEYVFAIQQLDKDYLFVDDLSVSEKFLKGD